MQLRKKLQSAAGLDIRVNAVLLHDVVGQCRKTAERGRCCTWIFPSVRLSVYPSHLDFESRFAARMWHSREVCKGCSPFWVTPSMFFSVFM